MNETDKTKAPAVKRKRNKRIVVYLNKDELAKVTERRDRSGLSLQSYCRKALLDKPIAERPCEHHAELLNKLSTLSNDAQEILKRLTEQGALTKDEIETFHFVLDSTWILIAEKY